MASVWKHPNSQYWTACFTDKDGRRRKKSTKEKDRKKALKLADNLEAAYRTRISEATARKLLSEAVAKQLGERIATSTLKDFVEDFLNQKRLETAPATHQRYKEVLHRLVTHLGEKAEDEMQFITRAELGRFRDREASKLSPNSVNLSIRIVRMLFKEAMARELIDSNPALSLGSVKRGSDQARRPFTLEEIGKLLKVANDEWRGIILFGLYTGQRLGDIASLTWAEVDLQEKEVALTTRKTGRRMVLPIVKPLEDYLLENPAPESPTAPVFPESYRVVQEKGAVGPLSTEFRKVMVAAGLVKKQPHRKQKDGRDGRRETKQISFHSLRHTATSMLKNAGVSDVIARDLIGHESTAVSASYTHIEMDAKRNALEKLPTVK